MGSSIHNLCPCRSTSSLGVSVSYPAHLMLSASRRRLWYPVRSGNLRICAKRNGAAGAKRSSQSKVAKGRPPFYVVWSGRSRGVFTMWSECLFFFFFVREHFGPSLSSIFRFPELSSRVFIRWSRLKMRILGAVEFLYSIRGPYR